DPTGDESVAMLVVTITGTNDAPTIALAEVGTDRVELRASDFPAQAGGQLEVLDPDLNDSLVATVVTVQASGTTAGLPVGQAALRAMLTVGPDFAWRFDSGSVGFDYLGEGESLTLSYTVRVTDSQGATADQLIRITFIGGNALPEIVIGE